MSKLDIGVGSEFPLDEGRPDEGRPHWKHRGHRHGRRHGRHHHHHGHHHRGLLHLPLIVVVAGVAALIGAGKISLFATHAILAVAAILVVLAVIAHFVHHRSWRGQES